MPEHLKREIESLKKTILNLGAKIESTVHNAALSIEERNSELAQKIIENDITIDQQEVEIEEECLKTLALYQPVAIDLRFIIAVLKINSDLERIGDLAVNIAERAVFLATQPKPDIAFDFGNMAGVAQEMLKKSLDALVNMSPRLAQEVCSTDNVIDDMNRQMYLKVQKAILAHPEQIDSLIHLLSVSRHLERIADHTTNIAEDVIYMIEGQIVRHRTEEYK
ncbi:MAG: phosphate signaling complex protein PhoU [Phycisphaerae bacterium]|jgi:phosphate transport system protein